MAHFEEDLDELVIVNESSDNEEKDETLEEGGSCKEEKELMEAIENILAESDDFDDMFDDLDDDEDDLIEEGEDKEETGADGELGDKLSESFELVEPIAFSEEHVRIFPRGDKYLVLESDFESVCFHYYGQKDGYQVLETIAESHGISAEDITIFLSEGSVQEPTVKVKKAKSTTGSAAKGGIIKSLKQKIATLNKQIATLPPNSPSAKSKKDQRKRLRAQMILHSNA
jgi:hypothetical protein